MQFLDLIAYLHWDRIKGESKKTYIYNTGCTDIQRIIEAKSSQERNQLDKDFVSNSNKISALYI